LGARNKAKRTARGFYANSSGRFVRVVDELVQPNARFRAHTEIGIVVKSQIRPAGIPGVYQLPRIDAAATRKGPRVAFVGACSLWPYRGGSPDLLSFDAVDCSAENTARRTAGNQRGLRM
jgi:hypothetical protein